MAGGRVVTARAAMRSGARRTLLLILLLASVAGARADEPVVTTLADFEDDSVTVRITDPENVLATDCGVSLAGIPARGQRSLTIDIGATERNASIACDLSFRLATPFEQADRVATHAWIKRGSADIRFRLRDAADRLFETPALELTTPNRWIRLVADLSPQALRRVGAPRSESDADAQALAWPIQIQGYRIRAHGIGRQSVYLDDLEVEHRVSGAAVLRGGFVLDKPTHIYEPDVPVRAAVQLENLSRRRALPLTVEMAWLRADGRELTTTRASLNLPASGIDYRSRQPVDFSQRIAEPGLYRLVARVRGPGWITPALETTIAVTTTNRALPRGRATFFGVQTNLLREPPADQLLEIDIADEIGAQLLALETPWQLLEPSPQAYDFRPLDHLLDRITRADIAAMIVLTEPPEWLAQNDADAWNRQAGLLEALARQYGTRLAAIQPTWVHPERAGNPTATDLAALNQIRSRIAEIRADIDVLVPSLPVPRSNSDEAAPPTDAGLALTFATAGDSSAALDALASFAAERNWTWNRAHRWFHHSEPLIGSGAQYDAVAVLRHFVCAAKNDVGGVIWFDLRDDTNDPRYPQRMNGLAQRDFSPKTTLLGFANAVGMLHGLYYAGELTGTPEQFESALFIGGPRQVAVLFPKPNRILPAVLAPYHLVDGLLRVFSFDRREQALTVHERTVFTQTLPGPVFITLDAQRAQSQPKIGLARPWLRIPAAVRCGSETTFRIEIDALSDLRGSYLQLVLPPDAPVESSLSSRSLRARAGETLSFDVTLTRTGAAFLAPVELTVRLRVEGSTLLFPVKLLPLPDVQSLKKGMEITDERLAIARLAAARPQAPNDPARDELPLHAAYQDQDLQIAIALPPEPGPRATLRLGIALENADTHAEVLIEDLADRPRLTPTFGTTRLQTRGWRCRLIGGGQSGPLFCHVTITARSLELASLPPGTHLLLAARYHEPPAETWALPRQLEWGHGLDGQRSTVDYNWIRLAAPPSSE